MRNVLDFPGTNPGGGMTTSKVYQDNTRRNRALQEFVDALHGGRMVAITGAMTTGRLGYPDWSVLIKSILLIAKGLAQNYRRALSGNCLAPLHILDSISTEAGAIHHWLTNPKSRGYAPDQRGQIWELAKRFAAFDRAMRRVGIDTRLHGAPTDNAEREFERRIAAIFLRRGLTRSDEKGREIVRLIIGRLGIRRIATLNYDFELERALMLLPGEQQQLEDAEVASARTYPRSLTSRFFANRHLAKTNDFTSMVGKPGSGAEIEEQPFGRWTRILPNGSTVISDVMDRERPDRLFEFAVGSAKIQRHIMHLHGRADLPQSMVANLRDYDQLYRRYDMNREPFDHGLMTLIAGNPILFLGLGMTEQEINNHLQFFVGNAPLRQAAPLFVIWNRTAPLQSYDKSHAGWENYKHMMRQDFLERLGVQVLFDDELDIEGLCIADRAKFIKAKDKWGALARSLETVEHLGERIDLGDTYFNPSLRAPQNGFKDAPNGGGNWTMWGVTARSGGSQEADAKFEVDYKPRLGHPEQNRSSAPIIAITGRRGIGRGQFSRELMKPDNWQFETGKRPPQEDRLLINAAFAYDSDSVLSGIARFLEARKKPSTGFWNRPVPVQQDRRATLFNQDEGAREQLFREIGNSEAKWKPCLIVINGAERFFGKLGEPISAGLDFFLRELKRRGTDAGIRVILLSSDRILAYCKALDIPAFPLHCDEPDEFDGAEEPANVDKLVRGLKSRHLRHIRLAFWKALGDKEYLASSDLIDLIRACKIDPSRVAIKFLEAHLDPACLKQVCDHPRAAIEVLRVKSFIGRPVEAVVLAYVPRVRRAIDPTGRRGAEWSANALRALVKKLCDLGLILRLDPHYDDPDRALAEEDALRAPIALHRAIATYFRDLHGAPVNDAKLASSFNLSLFMSDNDGVSAPGPEIHAELGHLVDLFCGVWHDIDSVHGDADWPGKSEVAPDLDYPKPDDPIHRIFMHLDDRSAASAGSQLVRRATRDAAACLRAAFSLVRSYYSTSALLRFEHALEGEDDSRQGALTEHAKRLDRLAKAFRRNAAARACFEERQASFVGPAPFYADELIWLCNERAVVALTQGDLPGARSALADIRQLLDQEPPEKQRSRGWRRIAINRVSVLIERGRLGQANELLDQIEADIDEDPWENERPPVNGGGSLHSRAARIRHELQSLRETIGYDDQPFLGDPGKSREECFILAMVTGYRGVVAHFRSDPARAEADYLMAIAMLQVLGEHRAGAHFQRHYARLLQLQRRAVEAMTQIEASAATAKNSQQFDLWHRCMIVRANLLLERQNGPIETRRALDLIRNARDYATDTDCHRIRIEANSSIARHVRHSGNYGTALRHIADALAIASRYRHSLMMTSLRIELGKILEDRGDPKSGRSYIRQAIEIAAAKGHSESLERIGMGRESRSPRYF